MGDENCDAILTFIEGEFTLGVSVLVAFIASRNNVHDFEIYRTTQSTNSYPSQYYYISTKPLTSFNGVRLFSSSYEASIFLNDIRGSVSSAIVALAVLIFIFSLAKWALSLYSFISWIIKLKCKDKYDKHESCYKFPSRGNRGWNALQYWLTYFFNLLNGIFIYEYTLAFAVNRIDDKVGLVNEGLAFFNLFYLFGLIICNILLIPFFFCGNKMISCCAACLQKYSE